MGVDYAIFAATEDELRAHFVGWKEPLENPRQQAGINPFTKQPTLFPSWDPDPEREARNVDDLPPRWRATAIDEVGLQSLMETIEGGSSEGFLNRPALVGPAVGPLLFRIPASFVDRITSLDEVALEAATARWTDAQRQDLEGIANASTRQAMLESRPASEFRRALADLLEFFRQHGGVGSFFLRITW